MIEFTPRVTTIAVVSTASAIMVGAVATAWWQRRKNRIPDKWRRVGELVELTIYPLKSGAGLDITEAECTDIGCLTDNPIPVRDRFLVIATQKGTTKTARQHPNMLKIKTIKADEDSITFQAPGMNDLTVSLPKTRPEKVVNFTMWQNEHVQYVDCGDEAAEWIHSYLNLREDDQIRLGYFLKNIDRRDLGAKEWAAFKNLYPNMRRTDGGVFSDMASFMIINEASVTDLRKRLGANGPSVAPCWFRPNFVVRGPTAYAEDKWNFIKIGDSAVFQYFKPCTRCILTTVDPDTCAKNNNMEPLKTLRTYRMLPDPKYDAVEKSPAMGCYLGLRRPGSVKVGDSVYIGEQ